MIAGSGREQLGDLAHRYAYLVDRRELSAAVELFTADAVLVLPDPPARLDPVRAYAGRQQIAEALAPLHGIAATMHGILGLVLEPAEPGTARGWVSGVAHHVTEHPDGAITDLVWYLRYADHYRHDDGRWLIARRELSIEWIEVRPVRRRLGRSGTSRIAVP
ncbi:nuclear transport factor 2 family protein [Dactylosporangium salmoneum]|uniref:SnoaL-like domain-containing protein n=1 Tax=Dactylosporangium salmoneum TaxID=53361 RepID=A0ABN3GQZ7_9ACTN